MKRFLMRSARAALIVVGGVCCAAAAAVTLAAILLALCILLAWGIALCLLVLPIILVWGPVVPGMLEHFAAGRLFEEERQALDRLSEEVERQLAGGGGIGNPLSLMLLLQVARQAAKMRREAASRG